LETLQKAAVAQTNEISEALKGLELGTPAETTKEEDKA